MAKKKNPKKRAAQKPPRPEEKTQEEEEEPGRLTLEALDAMSSSEDEGGEAGDEEEWNAEALALRQAIAEGAFDHLLEKTQEKDADDDDDDDEDIEEVNVHEEEEEEQDEHDDDEEEDEEESDSDSEDEEAAAAAKVAASSGKALKSVTEELMAAKRRVPWAEKFDVISSRPLPFGDAGAEGSPLDVHDDLKREVAFYNVALEAVIEGRKQCKAAKVPFSRPEDFFAEMVKTDDHMAMVKDRLIFETKKMNAVSQRKSNKEQKLRSKEKHANKIAEKSKRKKEHLMAVDNWAKSAANNRSGMLRDDQDDANMGRLKRGWTDRDGNLQTGPNKKRMAADKKYGHGGQRGRFKQNDPRDLNDMSKFNPKGGKAKGGSGANRRGKRARDASRARR